MKAVTLERKGRNLLSALIGLLYPRHAVTPEQLQSELSQSPCPRVLILRPHQGLGDLLLATPIFRALQEKYPKLEIHFLADTYNDIAIRHNPYLKKIWVYDKKKMKNPLTALAFFRELRAQNFMAAIPLTSHVPSFTGYWLARLSGAKAVVAYDTTPFYDGASWSKHLAHIELPNLPSTQPEWVKFMELVKPLIGTINAPNYAPIFETGPESKAWAAAEWKKINPPAGRVKIGLFFGGNPDRPERLWPAVYWKTLAVTLQREAPEAFLVSIVPPEDFLSGSRALERGVYPVVEPHLTPAPPVVSHRGLDYLAEFLKGLDLFVCVDGGIFHVAVASRVNTLGLFFKTDPACWKPPVPWATVLRPADDVPTSLPPAEVYHKIQQLVLKSKTAR